MRPLLLLLVGCNQVYDLGSTRLIDAQYFDASEINPGVCPAFSANCGRVYVSSLNSVFYATLARD